MERYSRCVAARPETWQRDCHYLKMSIAQCTSSHTGRRLQAKLKACMFMYVADVSSSPIIRKIRQECAGPFEAFERCMQQNPTAVDNCTDHVNRFLLCADQVKQTD
ncbi:coiled-coil-helix-coiled-coil-helix domain-containing protein 5 isoform X2 [Tachyglossus aculeatus]|nr:coiled-coil-helix-coiled-coil-helix domain-containing protein 5 isoform X2 [Tachyglossus aculeatus]XP_038626834.1 coiled-coil-helix-coiled-coil-helix domain-containing protein 5 isoform X2 [Tachyglossus aculeatus]